MEVTLKIGQIATLLSGKPVVMSINGEMVFLVMVDKHTGKED